MSPPYIVNSDGTSRPGIVSGHGYDRTLRIPPTDLSFIRIDQQTRLQFDIAEVVIESPITGACGKSFGSTVLGIGLETFVPGGTTLPRKLAKGAAAEVANWLGI